MKRPKNQLRDTAMKYEMTLSFGNHTLEDIKNIKKYYNLKTDADVFKKSLQLLKFAVAQEKNSHGILFEENEKIKRIKIA